MRNLWVAEEVEEEDDGGMEDEEEVVDVEVEEGEAVVDGEYSPIPPPKCLQIFILSLTHQKKIVHSCI